MVQKTVGLVLLLIAGLAAFFSLNEKKEPHSAPPHSKRSVPEVTSSKSSSLSNYIAQDLQQLKEHGFLPKAWDEVSEIHYQFHATWQTTAIDPKALKFSKKAGGTHRLEVDFIDVPDPDNQQMIAQFSLIDNGSKNKVWELGRTYSVGSFLQQKLPKPSPKK